MNRRILPILLLFSVLAAFRPSAASAQNSSIALCDLLETLSEERSPNGELVATVIEEVCSAGTVMSTVVRDRVYIGRSGEDPKDGGDVLVIDEQGHSENRPLAKWIAVDKLQINIANKSLVGLRKTEVLGAKILLRFVPPNPEERARWLKSIGQPPDPE